MIDTDRDLEGALLFNIHIMQDFFSLCNQAKSNDQNKPIVSQYTVANHQDHCHQSSVVEWIQTQTITSITLFLRDMPRDLPPLICHQM